MKIVYELLFNVSIIKLNTETGKRKRSPNSGKLRLNTRLKVHKESEEKLAFIVVKVCKLNFNQGN
jgi:hypothetical protein